MKSHSEQLSIAFPERHPIVSARKDDPVRTRCTCCGKTMSVPQWLFEQGLKLHFCGEACRKRWTSDRDLDGDGMILDGRPEYRGGNWEIQAQRARERDRSFKKREFLDLFVGLGPADVKKLEQLYKGDKTPGTSAVIRGLQKELVTFKKLVLKK